MPTLFPLSALFPARPVSILGALLAGTLSLAAADVPSITEVLIEPSEVTLTDADQSVQYLVTLKMSDGTLRDATRQAEFSAQAADGNANLVAIDHGRVTPKGDGTVTVSATVVSTPLPIRRRARRPKPR